MEVQFLYNRFLRRISAINKVKNGIVNQSLFQCRSGELVLSYHGAETTWTAAKYLRYCVMLQSGDLTGYVEIYRRVYDQAKLICPESAPDSSDAVFGDCHCEAICLTVDEQERLAMELTTDLQLNNPRIELPVRAKKN